MAISPYLANLRSQIGHQLVLLPAAAVLPLDEQGRLLLVRHIDTGLWSTIGGSIELDESPEEAAVREAFEEAGVTVRLRGVRAVLGSPEMRVTYPNGDECAYVSVIFDAEVVSGEPHPDAEETSDVAWFSRAKLGELAMDGLNRALLGHCGLLPSG